MTLTLALVQEARERIAPYLKPTPMVRCESLEKTLNYNGRIFIKCENEHPTGSFKVRGAFNNMLQLTEDEKRKGVITRSSGNFAQAVAYSAARLNVKATIVMPKNAPKTKVRGTESFGAKIIYSTGNHEEGEAIVEQEARDRSLVKLHPYNNIRTMAGQGTAALEVLEQVSSVAHFFCAIGGGGLLSGCSLALKEKKSEVVVHGIEPLGASDYFESRSKGQLVTWQKIDTIADGLRSSSVGDLNYPILNKYVDNVAIVTDEEIKKAMKLLFEKMHVVIEPSGAVSLAGFIKAKDKLSGDVVILLSGKNVDMDSFEEIIRS